jgi:hypothetical protein
MRSLTAYIYLAFATFPVCVKRLVYTMLKYSIVGCHQAPSSLLHELRDTLECGVRVDRQVNSQYVAVIQFERGKPCRRADIAVQRELDHKAFDCPVFLVVLNDGPQYLTDRLVHSFGRAIRLRMECSRHEELCPREPLKFTPENGRELGVSV